jgi:phosphoribosyl 1,2-cyclic phosphodiesterase
MAMLFKIFGSSSSGNCSLLVTDNSKVLVDAGFSARKICELLESCNESIHSIDAIFLTHEHSDHAIGIKGLSRYSSKLKIFANTDTAEAVQRNVKQTVNWQIFQTGSCFRFRDLEVTSFSIPHDAYDPVGFVFRNGGEDLFNPLRSVAWATDLGYVSALVSERVLHADVLVLEANYDHDLLDKDTRRPWSVKQRIKGRHGHLSNTDARNFLCKTQRARWQHVYLAHLSKDCNDVSLVRDFFTFPEKDNGFGVTIVDPHNGVSPAYEWL